MDGILNIYKEKGFTSHDVVAKLRGILHQRKIGHTGTLDPDAEGVLPVCLGNATKLCDMLTDTSKTYQTTMILGCVTDTQDISGKIISEHEVAVTEQEVEDIILSFIGKYDQIPPMYSAKKINGKKLYELAREGKEIERPACAVEIYGITIDEIQLPRVTMTVSCSKGTYIRTLCHDIGNILGCGACMETLLRTRVSLFSIEKSKKLSEIEGLQREDKLSNTLIPIEIVFHDLPLVRVSSMGNRFLYNGNPLLPSNLSEENGERDGLVRVYDEKGQFCAVYEFDKEKQHYRPQKMFLSR